MFTMKAAIYNPYLDTMGGGERYTLVFANILQNLGYKIDMQWRDFHTLEKLGVRFGLQTQGINVIDDVKRGDGYDVCFWVSDGSIPTLKARNNFLHFQFPFKGIGGGSLLNKMKLFRIKKIICNSHFTKEFIDEEYGVRSSVIYPPVDVEAIRPANQKENIILYVGRFSTLMQEKRQDYLVDQFKKLLRHKIGKWKLVLAGGVEVGVSTNLETLKKKSKGYPVEIVTSPNINKIRQLYGKAKIFWSAAGFGVDEKKYPQKVEHFGISAVEAMAGGSVPVLFAAGGHKEIVNDGMGGFLWLTNKNLLEKTLYLIKNRQKMDLMSKQSTKLAARFSQEEFTSNVKKLLL